MLPLLCFFVHISHQVPACTVFFYIWILAMLQYYVAVLTQQPLDRCHNNVIGSSENVEVPFYCLKEA